MTARAIVTDIEGTTTSLSFVHDVLFPLSRRAVPSFVPARAGDPEIASHVESIRTAIAAERGAPEGSVGLDDVVARLVDLIDRDVKDTALKAIQGVIWRAAWESGDVKSHVYEDVPRSLARFREAGSRLYVFSSGSVGAQRLLFRYTEAGDLTPMFDGYFDTTTGPKREAASYRKIAEAIGEPPAGVLFLSDVTEELDAAAEAGMRTVQLARPGVAIGAGSKHPRAATFDEIEG